MKRALSVFLSLLMLCTAPGMTAFAEDAGSVAKKETGKITAETVVETSEAVDAAEEAVVDEAAEVVATDAAKIEATEEVAYDEDGKALGTYSVTAAAELEAYPLGATVVINGTVDGAEGAVSYKWQKSLDGQTWGGTSLGGNSPVLSFTATEARLSYSYRLVVFADNGKVYSNPVKVELAASPEITLGYYEAVPLGAKVVINANCEGFTGEVSYQWQRSLDGQSWTNTTLSGNKSASLSFTATESRLSYSYRIVVKDQFGRYESAAAKVNVAADPVIKAEANKTEAAAEEQVIIKITEKSGLINDGLTYQWQKSLDGETWSNTSLRGYNTDKLNFYATEARLQYFYRVRVKDAVGTWYSNAVKVEFKEETFDPVVEDPEVNIYNFESDFNYYPENGDIVNYDVNAYGEISLGFRAKGAQSLLVTIYTLDEEPDFSIDQIDAATHLLAEEDCYSAFSSSYSTDLYGSQEGRYYRVKVVALDEHYEQNGATKTLEFAIRISRHVAVLIANGDYAGTVNDLEGPPYDGDAVKGMLEQNDINWEVYLYNDKDAVDMKNAMKDHFSDTTESDVCLFYYSGHGASNGSLCGVNNTYLSTSQLAGSLNQYTKGKVIVLLDSCFSGTSIGIGSTDPIHHVDPTADEKGSDLKAFNENVINAFKGLNATVTRSMIQNKSGELCVEDKFYVITAAAMDQTSLDFQYDGYRAGYFTHHLLEALGSEYPNGSYINVMPADVNGDWSVNLGEAFTYITETIADPERLEAEIIVMLDAIYDDIAEEWAEYAEQYGEEFLSEYPTVDDWYNYYLEYCMNMFSEDMQVTCAYGDANFIMFRREPVYVYED
ncbi:MAG: caspase family protein [Lachnospiraceae bacterium]|nr:caspase family protein [Lachnospiraceae bacterium]